MSNQQRGDTIIEVVIAMTLLGIILMGAYSLGNRAARLAQQSRDRVKATQIMQEQAEALRWLRDNSDSWSDFQTAITSASSDFVMYYELSGGSTVWTIKNVGDGPPTCGLEYDCGVEVFFNYKINADFSDPNLARFNISVEWERIGGGNDTTELEMRLGNILSVGPEASGAMYV